MFTQPVALANKLAIAGSCYQPSKFERRAYSLLTTLAASSQVAFAAGGTQSALQSVATTVIGIVSVVFTIALVVGLIRVVIKFVQAAPDALGSLAWLVGGVILWFGFQLFKDDLANTIGGPGGITK